MHRFVKLNVYQKALSLVALIYKFSGKLPESEKFGLISQIRRAATSVVLNIAEGAGAGSDLEFCRFLRIALRSTYEMNATIDVITELKLADENQLQELREKLNEIGAMISGLIKSLNKKSVN